MTIGIDIDDTMTNSTELIMDYAKEYFNETSESKIIKLLSSKLEGKLLEFYMEKLPILATKYTLKDNAIDVINRLRKNGYKVIVITARGHSTFDGLIDITKNYFKDNQIEVDDIIFKCGNKNKACLENNVDIMIDDSINTLNELTGAKKLLFSSVVNKAIDTDINRVYNWLELESYIYSLYN